MRVGICGIRGIPACYGGFETFAEELSTRLAARGHEVVVYGRTHFISWDQPLYRGVRIKLLRAPRHKYLETPVHTLFCLLDLLRSPVDALLVCNAANSPFIWLARLRGMPVAVNVDGVERKRKKWNFIGRAWYRLGELCSVLFSSEVVADADVIADYYRLHYACRSTVIRYGYREADNELLQDKISGGELMLTAPVFAELGVAPGKYLLYVSRLEPENNAHVVIEAYKRLPENERSLPLLIVGDAPYAQDYIDRLRQAASGENVLFAGYRFGQAYEELQKGALLYIQATEVGGTHPALVEAMGFANCVIANETPENVEVLGDAGLFYRKNDPLDLREKLAQVLGDRQQLLRYRQLAFRRAQDNFSWNEITKRYEELFEQLTGRPKS